MQPDYQYLIRKTGINLPVMGLYDVPDPEPFKPFLSSGNCLFAYYKRYLKGQSVVITRDRSGCGGAGKWLCDIQNRSRQDYIEFLTDDEGLKADHNLMGQWLDASVPYKMEHEYLVFGPLKESEYDYLKTVSFFINPDQLSMLMIGAQYYHSTGDPEPVIAHFGSGCMQILPLFGDLSIPQAIIGGTDMAMRRYIPPDLLIFTVTKPMFELLCRLDSSSFLEKSFIQELKRSRKSI